MKKVIGGKRYDTSKANVVAEWDNGLCCTDFHHAEETLYVTAKGAFFLYGEGGALSPWSQAVGDMRGGGSGIQPMSNEDALDWLEQHGKTSAIEQYFADTVEDA